LGVVLWDDSIEILLQFPKYRKDGRSPEGSTTQQKHAGLWLADLFVVIS